MRILLAIDESDESKLAVRALAERAWPAGTQVRVLNVIASDPALAPSTVPVPSAPLSEVPPWPEGTLQTRELLDAAARRIADAAVQTLHGAGLRAETAIRQGSPGSEIIAEARELRADLIVVGSHGRSAISRILLGSVASYVMHHAPCSVEIVREPRYD